MQLDRSYRLSDRIGIRPERFGAVLYDIDRRKLFFVRSRTLVDLLAKLSPDQPLDITLRQFCQEQALAPGSEAQLAEALERLHGMGIVRDAGPAGDSGPAAGFVNPAVAENGRPAASAALPQGVGSKYAWLRHGLNAPICLTWEVTYACNLRCVHCLSSSPRLTTGELTTEEAHKLIDDLAALQVFYINVGGGEPLMRPDFLDLTAYCVERGVGVKFSTNGALINRTVARRIAGMDYVDVQISVDGATAEVNDPVRGRGSFARARRAMELLAAESAPFKINTVVTRENFPQLEALYATAGALGAQLRLTRLRPSGRGGDVWSRLRLTQDQQLQLYAWLRAHPDVLTADSFFHLSALGEPVEGMNMCGAGRLVCSIDPNGNVYACPFLLDDAFYAGNLRVQSMASLWRESPVFQHLRESEPGGPCQGCGAFEACHGGCLAAKFFNDLPADGPDPECVLAGPFGPFVAAEELPAFANEATRP